MLPRLQKVYFRLWQVCVSRELEEANKEDSIIWYDQYVVFIVASSKYTLNTLIHVMFGWIYDVFAFFIRLFRPFSSRITMQAWSQQQVAFLIENICLLAESSGLNSVIMNGYSEAKVQEAFKIPYNFQVSAVIALGYKKEECNPRRKGRFPFGKLCVDVIIDRICSI